MGSKRIITRAILSAVTVGSIATGIAVPLVAAAAPVAGTTASVVHPDSIGYSI